MNNVDNFKEKDLCSSCLMIPSEEEKKNLSYSCTLSACRHHCQQKRKKKSNASILSLISTPSSKTNLTLQRDLLCQGKENDNNNNNNNTLKIAHDTSIISSSNKKTWEWKQNDGGFQHDVLTNDNSNINDNEDDGQVSCSSSSSAAAAADCLIRRQRRKQTRLKRKTGSEKRNERKKKKKKKKERNKKSPSSTSEAEATEASLFQFFTLDNPTIDTSVIFHPYEHPKCINKTTTKKENYISIQTSGEHQQQQQKQEVHD